MIPDNALTFIMKFSRLTFITLTLLSVTLTGCGLLSTKKVNMLQDANSRFKKGEMTLVPNELVEYRLQANDVLSIRIKSLDQEQVEYLSLETTGVFNVNPASAFMNGYSLDNEGMINMPGIGEMKVGGLTINEAREKIQQRIRQTEVGDATVFVNLVSFKVSVIGEVNNPNQYYVYNNQLTLIEAISQSGGFTDFADREHVKLIRTTNRGTEVTVLDFKSADILSSKFFYLQPNDMLVVDALEEKFERGNLSTLVIINTLVSGISATVAIVSLIRTTNQQPE